eukprot:TRINITY_DN2200_c0_g1_i4.p1 TRINITY_DN2200_c0_g1~~TRINITY_DN2200_c0_g1_i4.p1  ORF type:complete len:121 (-),score=18.57 TRINITY_DN2200_c0_g1_i4:37-399(-)
MPLPVPQISSIIRSGWYEPHALVRVTDYLYLFLDLLIGLETVNFELPILGKSEDLYNLFSFTPLYPLAPPLSSSCPLYPCGVIWFIKEEVIHLSPFVQNTRFSPSDFLCDSIIFMNFIFV